MRGFHWYFKVAPTVRAYVARPLRWGVTGAPSGCFTTVIVWTVLLLTAVTLLHGQVDAVLQLNGRDAQMQVANPTRAPQRVTITLFKDTTLTDSVPADRKSVV